MVKKKRARQQTAQTKGENMMYRQINSRAAQIQPINPWKLMDEVIRSFENTQAPPNSANTGVDVLEAADHLLVRVNLPGVKPENLDLNLEKNVLTLSAKTELEALPEGVKYLWHERAQGEVKRQINLPERLSHDGIEAKLEDGVLSVKLMKAPESTAKKITVASAGSLNA
jgi:HSP20 family protein